MAENQRIRTVGGQEAGYLFEFREDGVYLTVYPNEGDNSLFELSDMQQVLTEYGAAEYDAALLAKVVRSADGKPYRIAEHFVAPVEEVPSQPTEMKYTIEVSKDHMEVKVRLDYRPGTIAPAFETIMGALQEKKIVYGIDEEAIRKGLEGESDFIAARGKPQENGRDAEIKRNFSLQEKGKPAKMQYDKVDYKNLNLFVIARKGQVLVERIPHTSGTPGMTVFGNEVIGCNAFVDAGLIFLQQHHRFDIISIDDGFGPVSHSGKIEYLKSDPVHTTSDYCIVVSTDGLFHEVFGFVNVFLIVEWVRSACHDVKVCVACNEVLCKQVILPDVSCSFAEVGIDKLVTETVCVLVGIPQKFGNNPCFHF